MRPLEYLGLDVPGGAWTDRDRKLAEGLMLHEADLHSCGHPRKRSFHPEMNGWYEAVEEICEACASVELAQAKYSEKNKPEPGTVFRSVDKRPADKPLPPRPGAAD